MKFYFDVLSRYGLPTIRAMLAIELADRGWTQEMIAEKLDVTQAAVSQYLRSQRGVGALQVADEELAKDIVRLADKLQSGMSRDELSWEMVKILKRMDERGLFKKFGDLYPKGFFSMLSIPSTTSSPEETEK